MGGGGVMPAMELRPLSFMPLSGVGSALTPGVAPQACLDLLPTPAAESPPAKEGPVRGGMVFRRPLGVGSRRPAAAATSATAWSLQEFPEPASRRRGRPWAVGRGGGGAGGGAGAEPAAGGVSAAGSGKAPS
jgi:hypothetical protein